MATASVPDYLKPFIGEGPQNGKFTVNQNWELDKIFYNTVGRYPTPDEHNYIHKVWADTNKGKPEAVAREIGKIQATEINNKREVVSKMEQDLGRPPTEEEIAAATDPNNTNSLYNPNNPNEIASDEGKRAAAEKSQTEELANRQKGQIDEFAKQFGTDASGYRTRLAERLAGYRSDMEKRNAEELTRYNQDLATSRQKTFEQANPFILEDLNRRGLFNSETAVNQEQANALAKLQAADEAKLGEARLGLYQDANDFADQTQNTLTAFDTGAFETEQDIRGEGLNVLIGGEQSALDRALELRRGKLQRQFELADSALDRAQADDLARKKRKNDTLNAGIGAAGSVASGGKGS